MAEELKQYTGENQIAVISQDSGLHFWLMKISLKVANQEAFDTVYPKTGAMIENGIGRGDQVTFVYEFAEKQDNGGTVYRNAIDIRKVRKSE